MIVAIVDDLPKGSVRESRRESQLVAEQNREVFQKKSSVVLDPEHFINTRIAWWRKKWLLSCDRTCSRKISGSASSNWDFFWAGATVSPRTSGRSKCAQGKRNF